MTTWTALYVFASAIAVGVLGQIASRELGYRAVNLTAIFVMGLLWPLMVAIAIGSLTTEYVQDAMKRRGGHDGR